MIYSHTHIRRAALQRKGFSLVEILVVIAIIALLAGVSFPVAGKITHNSQLKKNKAIVTVLHNAIDRFHAEYGYLPASRNPSPSQDTTYSGSQLAGILEELEGKKDELEYNYKNINFLEAMPSAEKGKNGLVRQNDTIRELVNAMGEPVFVRLDYTVDEEIDSPQQIEGRIVRGEKALVWTFGHRDENASADEVLDDSAASWR